MSVDILIPLIGIPLLLTSAARMTLSNAPIMLQQSKFRRWMTFLSFIVLFFCPSSKHAWLLIGFCSLSLRLIPHFFIWRTQKQLRERLLPFLDETIMGLRAGQSFRKAFRQAASRENDSFRKIAIDWMNRLENGVDEKGLETWSAQWMREWIEIEHSGRRQVDDLNRLRNQIRIEAEFRRKSSLASLQPRIQALFSVFLFVPAFLGNLIWFDWHFKSAHLFSGILFLAAQVWILTYNRRLHWKI